MDSLEEDEKPEVVVVSSKGQVVIPQEIRDRLRIGPKTKLLVYGFDDGLVMKRLEIPDVVEELRDLYRRIDVRIEKYGELSESEIQKIIERHRKHRSQ